MHDTIRFRRSSFPCLSSLRSGFNSTPTRTHRCHLALWWATAFLFLFTAALANAKDYTRIVVFGDSLSDTGNMAYLYADNYKGLRFPAPWAGYTDGRFTDGSDTFPTAHKYTGVWVEQFAALMPSHPELVNSLDEGTNYAYAFALTGEGAGLFYPENDTAFNVTIDNMGQQITDYLATKPKINNSTLFVIWGGANDLLHGNPADIAHAADCEVNNIKRLIKAGATQFLVLNLPPLGITPRVNQYPDDVVRAVNAMSALFNYVLAEELASVRDSYRNRHVVLFQLDVFSLFTQIAAAPEKFALANITTPSQGAPVDPDTYLFWDDIHPTTRGHSILAAAAVKLVASPQCDSLGMPSCAAATNR